jgi:hypothetical protein
VFCARLVMYVLSNSAEAIVCERQQDNLDYRSLNPYLRNS